MDILGNISLNDASQSIAENTFEKAAKSFEDVMDNINKINTEQQLTFSDTLAVQESLFKYTFYQEVITKVVSKTVTAINDVMRAQ